MQDTQTDKPLVNHVTILVNPMNSHHKWPCILPGDMTLRSDAAVHWRYRMYDSYEAHCAAINRAQKNKPR
jgi:hypothetical protein